MLDRYADDDDDDAEMMLNVLRCQLTYKLRPMPKHGSVILYVHGNQKAR